MEFRITVTIADHGFSDEAAERCYDAFADLHAQHGPVVDHNSETGELSVTVSLDATDPWAAANLGSRIIGSGLEASGLERTGIIDVCVTAVEPDRKRGAKRAGHLVPV